jgi:hypothetical protein
VPLLSGLQQLCAARVWIGPGRRAILCDIRKSQRN